MLKFVFRAPLLLALALCAPFAFCGVTVNSPSAGSSTPNPVHFVATATTSCSKGVSAVGIYDNDKLVTVSQGSKMDTSVYLNSGSHTNTVVQSWDNCGAVAKTKISLNVSTASKTIYNLEQSKGWLGYGELPPVYDICSDCTPMVQWGMKQNVTAPAATGVATRFDIGGDTPYSDALWVNHIVGDGSTQGLLDSQETLNSSIHHLTYDVYFYAPTLSPTYALEFDIGQYVGQRAYLYGTMCRVGGNQQWAVWDNPNAKWVSTGIHCDAVAGKWNHLTIQAHRNSSNQLVYESITLNNTVHTMNWVNNSIPRNWHGIVVNFQLDGNSKQTDYSVYLNNLHITYY